MAPKSDPKKSQKDRKKKPYSRPRLTRHGRLAQTALARSY
jgi:hypothetical protein